MGRYASDDALPAQGVVFVDDIAALPQAILDHARAGDVVVSMGAGSIGNVPGLVLELQHRAGAIGAATPEAPR